MKKIVAIGGGEIGRPGYPTDIVKIDKEIIKLTGKKNPKLLFLPTASSDSEFYCEVVKKYFGKKLGCQIDILYLVNKKITQKIIKQKIFGSDIIYVGGGNTLQMMKIWRKCGLDKILKQAHTKGIVLAGLSAGSICWFEWGNSDSRRMKNPQAGFIKVSGLGLIKSLHCPHFDVEKDRRSEIKNTMRKDKGVCIALDNCCALEVIDDKYRIVSSKATANAYKIYWQANRYYEVLIKKEKDFRPLKELLTK